MGIKAKFLGLIFPILFLFGCAGFSNHTVYISQQQIQTKLNEKLVIPISLLKVFDLSLSNANVKFDDATGRMHTKFDTQLLNQLNGKRMAGKLAISGNLQLDSTTNSVVLNDVAVDDFLIDGVDPKYADAMGGIAKLVGSQLLNGLSLYTVKPDSLKVGSSQYYPKNLKVTGRGLEVTLSPQQ